MNPIEAKIRKLMAMAGQTTASPNEAANAAAMAASLAAQHNIDLNSVRQGDSRNYNVDKADDHLQVGAAYGSAIQMMGGWVARLFGCHLVIYTRPGKVRPAFVGQDHNTKLARSWMTYLWDSAVRANTEHARDRQYGSSRLRQAARESFRFQFANAVALRLKQRLEEMSRPVDATGAARTGTALAVAGWFDQERREVEQWMKDTRVTNDGVFSPRASKHMADAAVAGFVAGQKVGLDTQLSAARGASTLVGGR